MPNGRWYYYLVDGLTDGTAAIIRKGLAIIPDIRETQVSVAQSMIEVRASRDVEAQVRVACDVAGIKFRTRARI